MSYLGRKICLPAGGQLLNHVVEVKDGVVADVYPFVSETASMELVDVIVIKSFQGDECSGGEYSNTRLSGTNGYCRAYSVGSDGSLRLLE